MQCARPPVASHFSSLHQCDVAGLPLLRCRNIKLIADSHGDFPHPFLSLGNNCSSVSAPLLLISYSGVETAHCRLPEMLYAWEDCSHSLRAVKCSSALLLDLTKWGQSNGPDSKTFGEVGEASIQNSVQSFYPQQSHQLFIKLDFRHSEPSPHLSLSSAEPSKNDPFMLSYSYFNNLTCLKSILKCFIIFPFLPLCPKLFYMSHIMQTCLRFTNVS